MGHHKVTEISKCKIRQDGVVCTVSEPEEKRGLRTLINHAAMHHRRKKTKHWQPSFKGGGGGGREGRGGMEGGGEGGMHRHTEREREKITYSFMIFCTISPPAVAAM